MTPAQALARQRRLVERLRDPAGYPYPVKQVRLIETHISFVLLTGTFAYKIKKAVDFGFVDYTRLAQRQLFCAEELRLNARLAPALYLDVVDIVGTPDEPRWAGDGPPIEFAVRMREFAAGDRLDQVLARGELAAAQIDALAAAIADFHAAAPRAPATSRHGCPETIAAIAFANLASLQAHGEVDRQALAALSGWSRTECRGLEPRFEQRLADGFVRECHGDLHLANIARFGGTLQIFDGIEFNPQLRWIDVVSDLAFLVMDLGQRGRGDYAWRLLNAWLEQSGDYAGLDLLRFYKVYRALVRAKVAMLRTGETGLAAGERQAALAAADGYLDYALKLIAPRPLALVITHGFAGAGKSVVAQAVAERFGCVRLRSDVERKRRQGLSPLTRSASPIDGGLYAEAATDATYGRLAELAATSLAAAYPVVIDAACLRRAQRERFRALARDLEVPLLILACRAPLPVLRQRIVARAAAGRDASEATPAVLERQRREAEDLGEDERALAIDVDTAAFGLEAALAEIGQRLRELGQYAMA